MEYIIINCIIVCIANIFRTKHTHFIYKQTSVPTLIYYAVNHSMSEARYSNYFESLLSDSSSQCLEEALHMFGDLTRSLNLQ